MTSRAGASRLELERQIFSCALRISLAEQDQDGVLCSIQQLYILFPDLLPVQRPPQPNQKSIVSAYDFFGLYAFSQNSSISAAFLRKVREFQRQRRLQENREEYDQLLTAGLILRKLRLRLSHDLVISRQWLIEQGVIPGDGTLSRLHAQGLISFEPDSAGALDLNTAKLPLMIQVLVHAQIIGPTEIQALLNQMHMAPDATVEELILQAGYVTIDEMKSLRLASHLLESR